MNRRIFVFICLLPAVFLYAVSLTGAQQPKKVPRIGNQSAGSSGEREEAFRQGLRDLGYIEGQTIIIEWRFAEGKSDQVARNAAELVRLKVDVIVTGGSADTLAAKKATQTIPIVMTQDSDPVGNRFVASLARPGGSITGLTSFSFELNGKRLELLKETIPRLSHVFVLQGPGTPVLLRETDTLKKTEVAARSLGLNLQTQQVKDPDDLNRVFEAITKARAGALAVTTGPFGTGHRKQIVKFAAKNRLPAIYYRREFVEDGGLISYNANPNDLTRRAAIFVDKILKGAKPADLPVEQPTKFELVINLKTAKQIGLKIPPNVLARADTVIK
ncbi:MAG: ABC transporter substrate-binding protein [Deltaproteobacteria bacterium]|nr:ABC transporter substrate-binding protein [Deltaproteobacteria bacterium]